MITKDSIESAYCFFHQKQRVYQYSTMDWQKDDIEVAIGEYLDQMDKELYAHLSGGNPDYLRRHKTFGEELRQAVEELDKLMEK